MPLYPGDIISHAQMCVEEGFSLQKGMNFRTKGGTTVILMSVRKGAPYADRTEDEGQTLIYEGHDVPKTYAKIPKAVDQLEYNENGKPTENGKFFKIAHDYKIGSAPAELVKVYEKIKKGIWAYNGVFKLVDAWKEKNDGRVVFKFKLIITDLTIQQNQLKVIKIRDLDHNRMIPTSVKLAVWKRDGGKCRECGSSDNLHFDHILPFSRGGTSLKEENIQLLCARHNLGKKDQIK
jgi:hypothetical protein